jgi:uncharacterized protein YecT (DUF1311 family)
MLRTMSTRRQTLTTPPPPFPALTKTQKSWLAKRKRELESALQEGRAQLDRGEGRPFDSKRLVNELKRRQKAKTAKKK